MEIRSKLITTPNCSNLITIKIELLLKNNRWKNSINDLKRKQTFNNIDVVGGIKIYIIDNTGV